MMNAAAPITGGMICPIVDAEASTPAAKCAGYPVRFIRGIVNDPVVTVLATELPEIMPKNVLETTAAFAGPPRAHPVRAKAMSVKNSPAPVLRSSVPYRMNSRMKLAETPIGTPKIPSVDSAR